MLPIIKETIDARIPATNATIIQIFAFFAARLASSVFPEVTALLIWAENTIATIPGMQQHSVEIIESTRYGTKLTCSP